MIQSPHEYPELNVESSRLEGHVWLQYNQPVPPRVRHEWLTHTSAVGWIMDI